MSIEESVSVSSAAVRPRGLRSVQKPTVEAREITFGDVLQAVNPLNHIPFVSQLNNNPVSPLVKMVGSAVIGGPIGLAAAAIDAVFEEATGRSVAGNVIHMALNGPEESASRTAQEKASQRYQSVANAHKRHFHTWRA